MPSPVSFETRQVKTQSPDGGTHYGPRIHYVLYDDGSIRSFQPEGQGQGQPGWAGEWRDVAPADDHADRD